MADGGGLVVVAGGVVGTDGHLVGVDAEGAGRTHGRRGGAVAHAGGSGKIYLLTTLFRKKTSESDVFLLSDVFILKNFESLISHFSLVI